jgi:ParB-like chromosome segregation protein Spo0J
MLVDLALLKPNPYRDFVVDPIDADAVDRLAASIEEDGFWGGVVCRRVNGHVEIAAGHHRVQAAMQAGMTAADVFVGDLDDAAMIRVYARENATQRGNTSSAVAGTVASAIRFLAKSVLTGSLATIVAKLDADKVRGNLTAGRGLGEDVIIAFLPSIPGVTLRSVRDQLANLHASGDYARIINEVREEIEREERAAAEALERAETERKAAEEAERKAEADRRAAAERAKEAREEAARKRAEEERQRAEVQAQLAERRRKELEAEAERLGLKRKEATRAGSDARRAATETKAKAKVTFDFEGVSRHLKVSHHVNVFRDVVGGPGVAPYLPVKNQAALAAELVKRIGRRELTGSVIRDTIFSLVQEVRQFGRFTSDQERREAEQRNIQLRMQNAQGDFARHLRGLIEHGNKILELYRAYPETDFQIIPQFREAVTGAKPIVDALHRRIAP